MKKPIITIADFAKLDLRVGKVLEAQPIENSKKLVKLKVDLGNDYGRRTILGGFCRVYKEEELIGKKFVFLANLESKKMMGEKSQGMIMAADIDGKPIFVTVPQDLPEGTIVR